jgi:hypothetical protein
MRGRDGGFDFTQNFPSQCSSKTRVRWSVLRIDSPLAIFAHPPPPGYQNSDRETWPWRLHRNGFPETALHRHALAVHHHAMLDVRHSHAEVRIEPRCDAAVASQQFCGNGVAPSRFGRSPARDARRASLSCRGPDRASMRCRSCPRGCALSRARSGRPAPRVKRRASRQRLRK